ncbi:MAG: DUF465 domain-containing protein [Deltaproteobacteria bacterium]|nr:MAG: DUF465 domain-containing protein [Deltaproteobacteria bacterium]
MEQKDQALIQQLCEENPRFRLLYEEHVIFEKQLREFDGRVYLSPEEELDRHRVQKLKLAGKDEMETILRKYRQ